MASAPLTAPPVATLAPFVVLLAAVAVLPLVRRTAHWWESNLHKLYVSLACGGTALLMLAFTAGPHESWTAAARAGGEFFPFVVLLGALYVISGGIVIAGDLKGAPEVNTGLLALGAVLANVLGTTGASMLLIRPMLRSNRGRTNRVHTVIFFIFLVSNMGGLLLPIGDPPLFLGYLRGVPFEWTLSLWPMWSVVVIAALTVFYAVDMVLWRREIRAGERGVAGGPVGARDTRVARDASEPSDPRDARDPRDPQDPRDPRLRITGAVNFVWLFGVVWATAVLVPGNVLPFAGWTVGAGAREAVTVCCALASLATTPRVVRVENRFTYGPIMEVAALFSGLFLAMQPALEILAARGSEMGIRTPAGFFWSTGALSSVLDNAPTYLVFARVGAAVTPAGFAGAVTFGDSTIAPHLLAAISCGAVFMGANTYIGNGPNLMVAAIARENGVPMPTFFGYMLWSGLVLLPIFALVTLVFFV